MANVEVIVKVASWLGVDTPPQEEALCQENVAFMKKAIEQCAEQCHPPAERVFLPTRLIDLGQDPAKDCPRLVITADSIGRPQELLEPVKYVALSYCWGTREEIGRAHV